jgi:hypothetical protein
VIELRAIELHSIAGERFAEVIPGTNDPDHGVFGRAVVFDGASLGHGGFLLGERFSKRRG